jgi:hypothetical protein
LRRIGRLRGVHSRRPAAGERKARLAEPGTGVGEGVGTGVGDTTVISTAEVWGANGPPDAG